MDSKDFFSGTWKLNSEKSNFDANHRPSSATMRWERNSEGYLMTAEGTKANGQVVHEKPLLFILDGKEHPMPDAAGFTAVTTQPAPNVIEVEAKNAGQMIGRGSYVVSEDGTTMTASVSGIDAEHRPFQTVAVFDRE
jgi:hypothetical protein